METAVQRTQRESAAQLRSAEAESQTKLQAERAAKERELKELEELDG